MCAEAKMMEAPLVATPLERGFGSMLDMAKKHCDLW